MGYISRSKQREQAFFLVFENMFNSEQNDAEAIFSENIEPLGEWAVAEYNGVLENMDRLDDEISRCLTGWKLSRIPKINLAILRLAVYEILFEEDIPYSVSINEAVEIAKKYSGNEDASFINGVLGTIVRGM